MAGPNPVGLLPPKGPGKTGDGRRCQVSRIRGMGLNERDNRMNPMYCRGVRGATTADSNERDSILQATRELLALMIRKNGIEMQDVASAVFSTTSDLDAAFPALAARQLGWIDVPLLCTHEINVPGSLERCIRVLIHWNTTKSQNQVEHIYVKEAVVLRPELSQRLSESEREELERWIENHMDSA